MLLSAAPSHVHTALTLWGTLSYYTGSQFFFSDFKNTRKTVHIPVQAATDSAIHSDSIVIHGTGSLKSLPCKSQKATNRVSERRGTMKSLLH